MRRTPQEEAMRWFRQSELNLDDPQFAMSGGSHHLAWFLAQQAGEKALKAIIYYFGADDVWGHSVAELCRDAANLDPSFSELAKDAAPLDKYYIPTRYPNGLPGGLPSEAFSKGDAEMAIAMAEKVLDFVRKRISPEF
jgi:HEPN domain-containing protein